MGDGLSSLSLSIVREMGCWLRDGYCDVDALFLPTLERSFEWLLVSLLAGLWNCLLEAGAVSRVCLCCGVCLSSSLVCFMETLLEKAVTFWGVWLYAFV